MEPDEIDKREFATVLRGYDRSEVDEFARDLAAHIRILQRDLATANAEVAVLKTALAKPPPPPPPALRVETSRTAAYKLLGEETTKVLVAAEEAAEHIRQAARLETAEVIADARREAGRIANDARQGRQEAEDDLRRLRQTRGMLAGQLEDIRRRLAEAVSRLQTPLEPVPDFKPEPQSDTFKHTSPAVAVFGGSLRNEPSSLRKSQQEASTVRDGLFRSRKTDEARVGATESDFPKAEPVPAPAPPKAEPVPAPAPPKAEPSSSLSGHLPDQDPVDRLIEEIRREQVESVEIGPSAKTPDDSKSGLNEVSETTPEAPSGIFVRRGRVLGDAPAEASRRLKRLFQEDQNELLHRLRIQRGKGSLEDNLGPEDEQFERFSGALKKVLMDVFRCGLTAGGLPQGSSPDAAATTIAGLVAGQVVEPLRSQLRPVVMAGLEASASPTAISERVSDVFRVWKGQRTEVLAQGIVYSAFHQGLLAAWTSKANIEKRWVLSVQEQQCPNDICKANAKSDFLQAQAPFASGHLVPPAHPDCTCTLEGREASDRIKATN